MIIRLVIFLILNFGALAIGGLFTADGVPSEWYQTLHKAPWTPPGWVFGAAWTLIMICFSLYMARLWPEVENKKSLLLLYGLQWAINVSWNPIFFHFHNAVLGLVVISLLTLLVGTFLLTYSARIGIYSFLLAPYLLWLLIATSLNAYIWWNNPST